VDNETAKYIISYFSELLTSEEKMAIRHTSSTYKLENSITENSNLKREYEKKGWLTSNQKILNLLKDGYEIFELNSAKRIFEQNPDKIYLNKCQKCEKLARTPYSKQCRFCRHEWHEK
jgi:hypothetical protein